MQAVFIAALSVAVVSAGYGPPRPANNGCGGGGGGGCGGFQQVQTVSCGGNGCGGGGGGGGGSTNGGSGGYWWSGNDSPFAGPPASHVSVSSGSSSGANKPHPIQPAPQNPFVQRPRPQPQQGYIQPQSQSPATLPQAPSTQNLVQPPMGICPASFVCVHWQLCRDGFVISDGTGTINKRIKDIPAQVASRYQSCGGDMICCGIPAGGVPPNLPQPQRPIIPQPQTPVAIQPPRPFVPQPQRPVAPQPQRPVAPQPQRPAPQPQRPVIQQPQRPAPQPQRPVISQPQVVQPAPSPSRPARPSGGYGRPSNPQNPLIISQPNPQPSVVNPGRPFSPPSQPRPQPQPQRPVSNPVGLVSPPSPQPNPMMGGMMMMGMNMPMRGGSCSAGTYCVQRNMCNPYTGFIIRDPTQLMAVWLDAPQVPLIACFIPDGSVPNAGDRVCCQESHPNAGGFD